MRTYLFSKRKTIICREGWYYLLVLGFVITGSILREVNLLMVLAGMMLFPFLFNWRAVVAGLRGVTAERKIPDRVAAGDLLVVDVTVNKRPKRMHLGRGDSWGLVIEDRIENTTQQLRHDPLWARVMISRLAAGETRRESYRARLFQRGRYQFGPLTISTRFPLGLLRRTIRVGGRQALTVVPRLGGLSSRWSMVYQESFVGSRRSRQKVGMLEGDFHGLRDWRPSDGSRWIHWRTTARRGSPVVRQFEQHQDKNLALLIDLCHADGSGGWSAEAVERAVSFAATVVSDVCHRGNSNFLLGVAGEEVTVMSGPASNGLMYEMLDTLAVARSDTVDRLPDLLSQALDSMPAGMSTVLVSLRSLDTATSPQFTCVSEHPRRREIAGRIVTIDAAGDELQEFFELD